MTGNPVAETIRTCGLSPAADSQQQINADARPTGALPMKMTNQMTLDHAPAVHGCEM